MMDTSAIMGWPQAILLAVALQRLAELALARRNTQRLRDAGAVEAGARHYPLIVAIHGAWLGTLILTTAPSAPVHWPLIALYAALQAGRVWTLATLGRFWTTRILVLPGTRPVRRGPYRWVRHPNYLIVALEIPVLPLAFGAWWTAVLFGLANIAVLAYRIHIEDATIRSFAG